MPPQEMAAEPPEAMKYPSGTGSIWRRRNRESVLGVVAILTLSGACDGPTGVGGDPDPQTNRVVVQPSEVTTTPSDSVEFEAFGLSESGDTTPVQLAWAATGGTIRSGGPGSRKGLFKASELGLYEVIAADTSGAADTAVVTVSAASVATVEVEPTAWTLTVGSSFQLSATARDSNGGVLSGRQVTWSTSAPVVAGVDASGRVTALAAGSATISATIGGRTGHSTITVTAAPPEFCLDEATTVEAASGAVYDYSFNLAGHAIDAGGVSWFGIGEERTLVEFDGSQAACFSGGPRGGLIDVGIPYDAQYECTAEHCPGGVCPTPCYAYHSASGLGPDAVGIQIVEDLEIRNSGDGLSMGLPSGNILARRLYLHDLHDDALESDFGLSGYTIEDNLLDRVNTAFAMRLRSSASGDQRNELWEIRNNLVRLHEFPNGYKQRPGHGNVFKLDHSPNEPRFRLTGNTIVVGPNPEGSTLFPPVGRVEECAANRYLFLGTKAAWDDVLDSDRIDDGGTNGERLAALNARFPGCLTIRLKPANVTIDDFLAAEGWTSAVASWKSSHAAGSRR